MGKHYDILIPRNGDMLLLTGPGIHQYFSLRKRGELERWIVWLNRAYEAGMPKAPHPGAPSPSEGTHGAGSGKTN